MNPIHFPVWSHIRRMRHRTPRYIYNRTRLILYDHGHPDCPWLTPEAVRLLVPMLRSSDRGAEFGSGRSTIWFAERVAHLTSVEHDEQWYARVSAKLKGRELANVDYILLPRDHPDELGDRSAYARAALDFADASIDFALIDGIYRDYNAWFMLSKIRPGGLLIIDNVNWFLPSRSYSPSSRTPVLGPNGDIWTKVAQDLANWRSIWTSSGVTDTAIFIKP
jgi:predicted O-methyltransferase YrrM